MDLDQCDGCGWDKEIQIIDEYGKGFCRECIIIDKERKS